MHRKSHAPAALWFLAIAALIPGCGGSSTTSKVPTGNADFIIAVTPSSSSVTVGSVRHFSAVARDANGNVVPGISFTWYSSNTLVAVSKGGGTFQGIAPGSVTVTATAVSITNSGHTLTTVTGTATLTVITDAEGVAAEGGPIEGGVVSLRDTNGQLTAGGTDYSGHFDIPLDGLAGPFLLKVEDPEGRILYGFATSAGTVNIDPYTDLLVREWYALNGADPAMAFAGRAPLPAAADVRALDGMLTEVLEAPLAREGLDTEDFSVLSTPFAADHTGFDRILDESRVDPTRGLIEVRSTAGLETAVITLDRSSGTLSWTLRTPLPSGSLSATYSLTLPASR